MRITQLLLVDAPFAQLLLRHADSLQKCYLGSVLQCVVNNIQRPQPTKRNPDAFSVRVKVFLLRIAPDCECFLIRTLGRFRFDQMHVDMHNIAWIVIDNVFEDDVGQIPACTLGNVAHGLSSRAGESLQKKRSRTIL